MNPKFFRNGIVMIVLVLGTAALLFTWINASTPTPTGRLLDSSSTDVAAGKVKKVVQEGDTLTVTPTDTASHRTRSSSRASYQGLPDDMVAAATAGGRDARRRHLQGEARRPTPRGSACS